MIRKGSEVDGPVSVSADVCVIGSGAGGAVVAKELAEGGRKVVVLEKGSHLTRDDFTMREIDMAMRAYSTDFLQFSVNGTVAVAQGQCVGGTTVINEALCFRARESVLSMWASRFGLSGLTGEALTPHYEKVETEINVSDTQPGLVNENNQVLLRGARALGYRAGLMRRNVRDCLPGCGFCQLGCPFDRKQDMRLTYLPKAIRSRALVFADAPVSRVLWDRTGDGVRVTGARGEIVDPVTKKRRFSLEVKAPLVVVACGAIASSHLLIRSGLPLLRMTRLRPPVVGDRLTLHANFEVLAEFDRPVRGFAGPMMTAYTDHFTESDGFMLEGVFTHPVTFANMVPGAGPAHREMMQKYDHMAGMGAIIHDTDGGKVLPVGFRYDLTPATHESAVKAATTAARIFFAAGARRVFTTHRGGLVLDSVQDIDRIRALGFAPSEILLASAHPQGGNPMGTDPKDSVVDEYNESHDVKGLFVCDASAFPTSLGVNPQLTVMALSTRAAHHILTNRQRYFPRDGR